MFHLPPPSNSIKFANPIPEMNNWRTENMMGKAILLKRVWVEETKSPVMAGCHKLSKFGHQGLRAKKVFRIQSTSLFTIHNCLIAITLTLFFTS